jgi:acyl carrier protein
MYFEKVAALIAEKFEMPVENITRDTSIIDDLGADSLDIVDMLMMLEEQYNLSIPDDVAQEMTTVGDVVDYIEENV